MKKIMCIIAIGVAMLTSCSEDDSVIVPEVNQEVVLLKQTINSNVLVLDYAYEGNKLMSIINNQGTTTTLTYTGDLITRIDKSYNDVNGSPQALFIEMEYDSNDKLSSYIKYEADGIIARRYELTYNAGYYTKKTYWGDYTTQALLAATDHVYIENGNITTIIISETESRYEYLYDTKNAPLKNILEVDVFSILENDVLFKSGYSVNNISSHTYAEMVVISYNSPVTNYSYNSNDYPETSTTVHEQGTANEWTETIQYIY